jgi:Uma2 family endonuclease
MSTLTTSLLTNTWIKATWDEYLQQLDPLEETHTKSYFYDGYARIEMLPVGRDHASDHTVITFAIALFTIAKGIAANGFIDCTYRKVGNRDCQPDISYYFGQKSQAVPKGTNIVNLDVYPVPDLAIEISNTSILDDRTTKRSLYEDLGVSEYWVVDVEKSESLAYAIRDRGSQRIDTSLVLPGLSLSILEAAVQQSREADQTQVGTWLMTQFSTQEP